MVLRIFSSGTFFDLEMLTVKESLRQETKAGNIGKDCGEELFEQMRYALLKTEESYTDSSSGKSFMPFKAFQMRFLGKSSQIR